MTSKITLSYIITTYNKLPFLKVVLEELIPNIEENEEIIVTDGGSSDGTPEFLEQLKKDGRIHHFISEKDKGEAHGFNKAIWISTGEIIKIITDDDAFYYPGIRDCKKYMLENPEVDVMGANTGNAVMENKDSLFWYEDFQNDFFDWQSGKLKNFFFNGTCLMLRRSSLPLIGVFNPSVLLTDLEYTLRITGLANMAWYSGIVSVRILNSQSNNLLYEERADSDSKKLSEFYNYKYPHIRRKEAIKNLPIGKKIKYYLKKILKGKKTDKEKSSIKQEFTSFEEAHTFCLNWLIKHDLNQKPTVFPKQ